MTEPVRSDGFRLKPEYYELWWKLDRDYELECCSCHIWPPCPFCTDEGNPNNLLETDDAWEDPFTHAVREASEPISPG